MKDDDSVASADQDAWIALAESVREQMAKVVPLMGAMKPDEVKTTVDAITAAMWIHERATTWDHTIRIETSKLFKD